MVGTFFQKSFEVPPRYLLSGATSLLTKFSGSEYTPWEENVVILHANLTGIAFAVPKDLVPCKNEWIELEFLVPSENELKKTLGKVIHVQYLSEGYQGVVVQFMTSSASERLELTQNFLRHIKSSPGQDENLGDGVFDLFQKSKPSLSNNFLPQTKQKWLFFLMVVFWVFSSLLILIKIF